MDNFLIYTNTMANFHLGYNAHREYRKVRDAAIAEVAELREKLRVYEEEVPAQLKAQADAALRLSAEMSELQDRYDAIIALTSTK